MTDLREYRKLRYMGDCKCGNCQLVPLETINGAILQIDLLTAALQRVVRDVNDYEHTNNLAPNPGRTECWDSVAYAKRVLVAVGSAGSCDK